jgi:hypothetical protein
VNRGRIPVTPGTRVVDRLGSDFSVSSRPIVLANRGRGGVQEGLRNYIREEPRVIERTSGRDSQRLAPVLGRQTTLPRETVDALRDRAVVADRGRLSGPGARDLAPSGAAVVERGSGPVRIERSEQGNTGRTVITDRNTSEPSQRTRPVAPSEQRREPVDSGRTARPAPQDSWRGGSTQAPREGREVRPRETSQPPAGDSGRKSSAPPASSEGWRGQPSRPAPSAQRSAPRSESFDRGREPRSSSNERGGDWRSRPLPPARRVIEGAVPGRRAPQDELSNAPRFRERDGASRDASPRSYGHAAPPRDYAPRDYAPRNSAPRDYAPRDYAPRESPRSSERAAPRQAPPPQAAPRSAPPPSRQAPPSRSAPSSRSGRPSSRS